MTWNKALAAALGGLATWLTTTALDDGIEMEEVWGLAAAVIGAIIVYLVPNKPPADEA
jgi:hypothetical protein